MLAGHRHHAVAAGHEAGRRRQRHRLGSQIGDVDGVGPEVIAVAGRRALRNEAGRHRDFDLAGYGPVHLNALQFYEAWASYFRPACGLWPKDHTKEKPFMIKVSTKRDLRLDLFRGIALWLIFLDHIPSNAVSWITIRNYGFSDATEIFVFISGYTAAFVYGRAMREHGFIVAGARVLKRAWQIY